MTRTRLSRLTFTLILGCTIGLLPAVAAAGAPRAADRPPSPITAAWEAVCSFWSGLFGQRPQPVGNRGSGDGGPHMDPDGLTAADESDGGPHWDPDGLTAADESDGGPHWDPNGLTGPEDPPAAESDGGPDWDPDG